MSQWKLLPPLWNSDSDTKLLVKHDFGTHEYEIFLTDFSYIWSEKLQRKELIRKALDQETSIDPSEGLDQMTLFLEHLKNALDGKEKTAIGLFAKDESQKFELRVHSQLPTPLPPFCWSIQLSQCSPLQFTSEFIWPIVSSLCNARKQVSTLIDRIKAKDHVISKLVDKTDSLNIDLGTVFPAIGIRGSAGANRRIVSKKVPALLAFEEKAFKAQSQDVEEFDMPFQDITVALGSLSHSAAGNWRKGLQNLDFDDASKKSAHRSSLLLLTQESTEAFIKASDPEDQDVEAIEHERDKTEGDEKEDDSGKPKVPYDESSTEDDLEDPETARKAFTESSGTLSGSPKEDEEKQKQQVQTQQVQIGQKRKIGLLGNRNKGLAPESIAYSSDIGKGRESAPQEGAVTASPETEEPKPRGRLGKIGGKTSRSARVADRNEEGEPGATRLGSIEVDAGKAAGLAQEAESPPVDNEEHTRETSQDRADRRRAELRRELEQKRQAPIRKKRKF